MSACKWEWRHGMKKQKRPPRWRTVSVLPTTAGTPVRNVPLATIGCPPGPTAASVCPASAMAILKLVTSIPEFALQVPLFYTTRDLTNNQLQLI